MLDATHRNTDDQGDVPPGPAEDELRLTTTSRGALWAGFAVAYAAAALPALAGTASIGPAALVLAGLLVALSVEDCRDLRLPDGLNLALLASGLTVAASTGPAALAWSATAALIGAASLAAIAMLYERARGTSGMGLGDAKLLGAAGSWVGVEGLASIVLLATLLGLAACACLVIRGQRLDWQTALPFGPFLAGAAWIVWLYGPI